MRQRQLDSLVHVQLTKKGNFAHAPFQGRLVNGGASPEAPGTCPYSLISTVFSMDILTALDS